MKALHKMDYFDRLKLLIQLFPDEVKTLQDAVQQQCEYYLKYETLIREKWDCGTLITADFWYSLVRNADANTKHYGKKRFGRSNRYGNLLYNGNNLIFTLYSLTEFTTKEECNEDLKLFIQLFFGKRFLTQIPK